MKSLASISNYLYYGVWTFGLIGKILGVLDIPWNYLLLPAIVLAVSTLSFAFIMMSNIDKIKEQATDESLIKLLEKRGYEVK